MKFFMPADSNPFFFYSFKTIIEFALCAFGKRTVCHRKEDIIFFFDMIPQQRNVGTCNLPDSFAGRLISSHIFRMEIAHGLNILSSHFMFLKEGGDRTILGHARSNQGREQQVFLLAVMTFVHKDFQKLLDSIKVLFIQIPIGLHLSIYLFQNIEHDLDAFMFVSQLLSRFHICPSFLIHAGNIKNHHAIRLIPKQKRLYHSKGLLIFCTYFLIPFITLQFARDREGSLATGVEH